MTQDTIALLALVGVLALALAGICVYVSGSARRSELAARGSSEPGGSPLRALAGWLDSLLRRTAAGRRLARWVISAGAGVAPAEFVLAVLLAWLAFMWAASLFLAPVVAFVLAGGLALAGARTYVERRRARRRDEFIAQLPDVARMLANGAAAGLSMAGAMEMAARELPDPAGAELRAVVRQMSLGQPLDAALQALRERLPSREVGVLMSTLVIQHRAGGDTVRALQELGSTLEARKDVRREIVTVLSGSVFTSYLVAGIAVGTILLTNAISPGVLREMTSTALGLAGLTVTAMMWAVAFVLIRRVTRVDV